MKIWEPGVLEKMAEVEFPERESTPRVWGSRENYLRHLKELRRIWMVGTMRGTDYSFFGALTHLLRLQHEHIEINTTSGLTPIPPPEGAIFEIYGSGGWNRWPVTFEGEVCFSKFHAVAGTELAEKLGFRLW